MLKSRDFIGLSLIAKAMSLTMAFLASLLAFWPQMAHTPKLGPGMIPKPVVRMAPKQNPVHTVVASWYGPQFHGKTMASGRPFNMHALIVAHRTIPLGTRLLLTNPRNGRRVKVRVMDRGPYIRARQLDVSYAVACRLGFVNRGVARLQMRILG